MMKASIPLSANPPKGAFTHPSSHDQLYRQVQRNPSLGGEFSHNAILNLGYRVVFRIDR